jgi:hypothetical protein
MSDEQQRQPEKFPRPSGLLEKWPAEASKSSTVWPIRSSLFSCHPAIFLSSAALAIIEYRP